MNFTKPVCTKGSYAEEVFSRKGAKTQSAAAFLRFFFAPFAPLREKYFIAQDLRSDFSTFVQRLPNPKNKEAMCIPSDSTLETGYLTLPMTKRTANSPRNCEKLRSLRSIKALNQGCSFVPLRLCVFASETFLAQDLLKQREQHHERERGTGSKSINGRRSSAAKRILARRKLPLCRSNLPL
jgi:hypothetical protein